MGELVLGFDADDTLWHNETVFNLTQGRFIALFGDCASREHLLTVELRNLRNYGYGVKSFTLSMIETALELTNEAIASHVVAEILEIGRAMLEHPFEPLPAVRETLKRLTEAHVLVLITKGDFMNQEKSWHGQGWEIFSTGWRSSTRRSPPPIAAPSPATARRRARRRRSAIPSTRTSFRRSRPASSACTSLMR